MVPVVPALLLGLLAAWSGTLHGGATAGGAITAQGALLGAALLGAGAWRDPLRLGAARLLPWALLAAVAASWWASPVRRAGTAGLLLLPAFLLLPAATSRCLREEAGRRRAVRALALVVGAVATVGLLDRFAWGSPRAALPLGHHNLLAIWLILLLPLALVAARSPGPWRWLAAGCGVLALACLAATGSRTGLLALAVEAAIAGGSRGRRRWWGLAALGLLAVALFVARPAHRDRAAVVSGRDPSLAARVVYLRAGLAGFAERPLLGWGPGAVPWTIGLWLRPRPGINPPGEIVGDLHSLPAQLGYELGVTGFVLAAAVAGAFLVARRREPALDPLLRRAAWAAAGGGAAASLASAAVAVVALPAAAAVVAGTLLAAGGEPVAGRRGPAVAVLLGCAVLLVPPAVAQVRYEQARRAVEPRQALRALAAAVRWDPGFPLYGARLAWARSAAGEAARAAAAAPGVGPLWLQAGWLGRHRGSGWAAAALERACATDPLGALAPFHRLEGWPGEPAAAARGARALLAEPSLGQAVFWEGRSELFRASVAVLAAWPGVDPRVRDALAITLVATPEGEGERAELALAMDADASLSLSVYAFRRAAWPARLAPVPVRRRPPITAPAAARLPSTSPEAFPRAGCGAGAADSRRRATG